jgi:hypothetical protein
VRLLEVNNGGESSLTTSFGHDIPPYAIFSHTWGMDTEEVTFEDLVEGIGKRKIGYKKIMFCGEQAQRDGVQYLWIDTYCIDKSSSTELTEAISLRYEPREHLQGYRHRICEVTMCGRSCE